jgi:HEPN domain-containing protein
MNRLDFQRLSRLRQREAAALLAAGHYSGAYYLIGYAVECALKARIAKQVRRHDFPDKRLANETHTHDIEKLVRLAGLAPELQRDMTPSRALELNWAIVRDWSETACYETVLSERQTRDLFSACTARRHGILNWIRRRW